MGYFDYNVIIDDLVPPITTKSDISNDIKASQIKFDSSFEESIAS